jgi:hypothetical protein
LTYYFDPFNKKSEPFNYSLIAISSKGEIVSHYGGLEYSLNINNKIQSMIWGVSAYTLAEYRGKGINSQIVDFITNNYEINGVIGFTSQTSYFYQNLGYNIFKFEKFTRHILILDFDKTLEVCNFIKQDSKHLIEQNKSVNKILNSTYSEEIIELTTENIGSYNLNLDDDFPEIITTHRTKEFLEWRFLKNPFIKYTLYGVIDNGSINAYIALRKEMLSPFSYQVNRIIDLFGKVDAIKILLQKTVKESVSKKLIYIDFSKFGSIYDLELKSLKFIDLEYDDCCVLPQVTSPIADRPNGEFIGIFSKSFGEEIKNLSRLNVYFTRIDSDRDRLANINQINHN